MGRMVSETESDSHNPSSRELALAESAEREFARGQGIRDRLRMRDAMRRADFPVSLRGYEGPVRGWDNWAGSKPRRLFTDRKIEKRAQPYVTLPPLPAFGHTRAPTVSSSWDAPPWTYRPGWTFAREAVARAQQSGPVPSRSNERLEVRPTLRSMAQAPISVLVSAQMPIMLHLIL